MPFHDGREMHQIEIETRGRGLYEFTSEIRAVVTRGGAATKAAVLFVRHTSCSLLVQENADPDVRRDLE